MAKPNPFAKFEKADAKGDKKKGVKETKSEEKQDKKAFTKFKKK